MVTLISVACPSINHHHKQILFVLHYALHFLHRGDRAPPTACRQHRRLLVRPASARRLGRRRFLHTPGQVFVSYAVAALAFAGKGLPDRTKVPGRPRHYRFPGDFDRVVFQLGVPPYGTRPRSSRCPKVDYVRTRLTHGLEASSIGPLDRHPGRRADRTPPAGQFGARFWRDRPPPPRSIISIPAVPANAIRHW